jgi:hypothetical protein
MGNQPGAAAQSSVADLHNEQATDTQPAVPNTQDAFLHLVPVGNAPPSGGTVSLGVTFTLDLYLNAGSNHPPNGVTAAQSYLTFSSAALAVIRPNGTCPASIPVSTTITADLTTFETTLQNEVCNGPQSCNIRGVNTPPGSIAFASGALTNCPQGCDGDFRVASIAWCAIGGGQATIAWQFAPPAPPTRDTEIIVASGDLVHNPALFSSYIINVSGPTATPATSVTPVASVTATPCPVNFSDVHPTDYFYEAVQYLVCHGAISGYADGTFRPYNNTTRGQTVKIIVLAMGWPLTCPSIPHFSDVPPDSPFYCYVETAYEHNIISGYADSTFHPNDNIARGQLTKVIVLAMGWPLDCPDVGRFSDVPPGSPFYCYVETAVAHNIISGYSDGTFRPGNNATRGQTCKIVYLAISTP